MPSPINDGDSQGRVTANWWRLIAVYIKLILLSGVLGGLAYGGSWAFNEYVPNPDYRPGEAFGVLLGALVSGFVMVACTYHIWPIWTLMRRCQKLLRDRPFVPDAKFGSHFDEPELMIRVRNAVASYLEVLPGQLHPDEDLASFRVRQLSGEFYGTIIVRGLEWQSASSVVLPAEPPKTFHAVEKWLVELRADHAREVSAFTQLHEAGRLAPE